MRRSSWVLGSIYGGKAASFLLVRKAIGKARRAGKGGLQADGVTSNGERRADGVLRKHERLFMGENEKAKSKEGGGERFYLDDHPQLPWKTPASLFINLVKRPSERSTPPSGQVGLTESEGRWGVSTCVTSML